MVGPRFLKVSRLVQQLTATATCMGKHAQILSPEVQILLTRRHFRTPDTSDTTFCTELSSLPVPSVALLLFSLFLLLSFALSFFLLNALFPLHTQVFPLNLSSSSSSLAPSLASNWGGGNQQKQKT